MLLELSIELFGLLFAVAIFAGVVDAISGGGGLIAIPALMLAGFSPVQAIATTKLQSFFGKLSASTYFFRKGKIPVATLRWPMTASFFGAICGAITLRYIDADILQRKIPYLLGLLTIVLLTWVPRMRKYPPSRILSIGAFSLLIATVVGFYDGFFGAASGTFFTFFLMLFLGFDPSKATASTKLLLLVTNAPALAIFIAGGDVVWNAGFCMAAGQWIGSRMGAKLVVSKGHRIVLPVMGIMCLFTIFVITAGPVVMGSL